VSFRQERKRGGVISFHKVEEDPGFKVYCPKTHCSGSTWGGKNARCSRLFKAGQEGKKLNLKKMQKAASGEKDLEGKQMHALNKRGDVTQCTEER